MISVVLAATLAAAAPGSQDAARASYGRCLSAFMRASIAKPVPAAEFDKAAAAACANEKAAFERAAIAADTARKISRTEAQQMVASEIEDYIANAKEGYRAYIGEDGKPIS